jgi:hypothetical protein
MKKFVFRIAMALTGMSLVCTAALRAQDSGTIQIQDPAEFNAYQNFSTQTDPVQKCAAGESFLTTYPQSVVKKTVLEGLVGCYQAQNNPDKTLSAASRLLQIDPNNIQAIFISVYLKKAQCSKSLDTTGVATDAQTCDDAAALAKKGLAIAKPAGTSDDDWKKITSQAYPMFHSTIAFDCAVAKKDFKCAEDEYRNELMLYSADECTKPGGCLADTLQEAQAYAKPGDARDPVKAIWFYARAWDYAPPAYKAQIEPQLEYWYKRYHGTLDGDAAITQQIDGIKTQAQTTLFPPDSFKIAPAPSNADLANKYCAVSDDDLKKLALEDKEFILANASKDCTDKLWGLMKDQDTPVPGIVVSADASTIKMAVTQDAKDNKVADFIVNLKKPLLDKDIPTAGFEYKLQPADELDGTYDSYTPVPASGSNAASVQIVLREGFVQPQKKAPVHHTTKPAAGHKAQ